MKNLGILKKKLKASNYLTIVGGFVIFLSWVVERQLELKWASERERLNRSQLVIDIAENRRALYEVALINEFQKSDPDTVLLTAYKLCLTRSYLDLLVWSHGRVTDNIDEYSALVHSKRTVDEQNRNSWINSNYIKINENYNSVSKTFEQTYEVFDDEFLNKIESVNNKESFWAKVFTSLYVLGSILLGISYLVSIFKNDK